MNFKSLFPKKTLLFAFLFFLVSHPQIFAKNISPDKGEPCFSASETTIENAIMMVTFSDQTDLLSTTDFHSGVAMGVVDMNGDGLDDIVRLSNAQILTLEYQSANGGAFSTFTYGDLGTSNEWAIAIADVDHNGYNDILAGGAYNQLKLLRANNNGTNYTLADIPDDDIFVQGTNFVDIDNDGWVDIFSCHDDAESLDFRNTQDGNFVFDDNLINTTLPSGNSGNYASIWVDYDNDGDQDMYLSKCRGGVSSSTDPRRINLLFQNDGSNNFTEVGAQAGLRFGDQTWTTDFADIDNDGDMDAFIINHYTPSLLMENNGDGTFTDITAASGMSADLDLFGIQALFKDFDNDGFVDLIVTGTEHRLFHNNGDQTFTNIVNPFTTDQIESIALGDLNNDGFPDIYAGYANLFNSPTAKEDKIFMNEANSNNYLAVNLDGVQSNINGIGARLELHGSWGIQIREVRSGEGYGIMNSLTKTFGIGGASAIEKLVVKWPSGTVDEILNPNINSKLIIVEGSSPVDNGNCDVLENLALNKPASQSSVQQNGTADRAVDGNTDGNFWATQSIAYTNWETESWWEVNLQNLSQIEEINIYNRTDGNEQFLANYYILVSDVPFLSDDLNTSINQAGVDAYLQTEVAGTPSTISIGRTGQFVRIQQQGSVFLALAEVEVMGCTTNGGGPLNQFITFDEIPNKLTTDNSFSINASASSGLDVNYTIVSGPATISGNTISLTGAEGTVEVRASQAGNADFNPADDVNQSFTVSEPQEPGNCESTSNIAVGKPSIQSSTQQGALASRANDGNTNGNFWAAQSVSLTGWEDQPFWEVDLEQISQIDEINVWNRSDANMDFLSNYYVLVSDNPFQTTDLSMVLNQPGVSSYLQSSTAERPSTVTINSTGRFVRIQMAGNVFLGLAEVEVIGCTDFGGGPFDQTITFDPLEDKLTTDDPFLIDATASSGIAVSLSVVSGPASISGNTVTLTGEEGTVSILATQSGNANYNAATPVTRSFEVTTPEPSACTATNNLALNKPSSQSSLQQGAEASRANDGNTNGNFWAAFSVSHTNWQNQPWWEVDLEDVFNITDINLYNRTDVNQDQFADFYVLVSDVPFNSTTLNTALNQNGVDSYYQSSTAGDPSTISINRTGRYVRIQKQGVGFLAIAEAEVMGCAIAGPNALVIPEILTLDAINERGIANLNWVSTSNENEVQFTIEKSVDGNHFEHFKTVEAYGANEKTPMQYSDVDWTPAEGLNYYRVKQDLTNGTSRYSEVRSLNFEFGGEIKAFPNPAQGIVNLSMKKFSGLDAQISIQNTLGIEMQRIQMNQIGEAPVELDLTAYRNGMYLIVIQAEGRKIETLSVVLNKNY